MDSLDWDLTAASPSVKFEASPAESFMSIAGDPYPSLFAQTTTTTTNVSPLDTMTPPSEDAASSPSPSDKKQTKKRKSWGQVLPEPKTNLPPRKRAKTEDEKEQRRVERVLRNRRAAQSSRERKRLEVEALEKKNQELQNQMDRLQEQNTQLLQFIRSAGGVIPGAKNPITLSQDLFNPQTTHTTSNGLPTNWDSIMEPSTINPETLSPSPALSPVSEDDFEDDDQLELDQAAKAAQAPPTQKISPDLTQQPAALLCDLQCQSAEISRSWVPSQQPQRLTPALATLYCSLTFLLTCTSTLLSLSSRPLTQIALSLRAGSSLVPTPALLNTIILLVTRRSTTSSTLTSSSSTPTSRQTSTRRSPTLRIKVLRKLLACSPMLARPLMDATVVALRLVNSEEHSDILAVGGADDSSASWASGISADGGWLDKSVLPSKELLLTLLWAVKVESKRLEAKSTVGLSGALSGSSLKTLKRKAGGDVQHGRRDDYEMDFLSGKRRRV